MHDPRGLLVLLEVVDEGSMAAAARKLGVSRSTIARQVATLEDELGVQLLLRNTRDVSLSEAGEVYIERAREIRELIGQLEAKVHQLEDTVRGRLRIAVPIIDHKQFITPIVRDFAAAYPELELEVMLAEDITQIVSKGIDVGIQSNFEVNAALTMRRLLSSRAAIYASKRYVAQRGLPQTVEELAQHDALYFRSYDGTIEGWPIEGGAEELVLEHPRLVTNSKSLLGDAIGEGLGIGRLMEAVARPFVDRGLLVPVLPELVGAPTVLALVYPANRHVPPKVRAFIDFMVEWIDCEFEGAPSAP